MDVRMNPTLQGIPGAAIRPAQPAPLQPQAPVDGFQRSAPKLGLDKLNMAVAVSATAAGVAALAGAGDMAMGLLGLPALVGAPIATAALLLGKDKAAGALEGTPRMASRIASVAVTATAVAALAGLGEGIVGVLALPALVAAPVALGALAWQAWKSH